MSRTKVARDRQKARVWMLENHVRLVDIQRELEHKSNTQVVETLQGWRNHRKVLEFLLEKGCPAQFLDLPKDMRAAA